MRTTTLEYQQEQGECECAGSYCGKPSLRLHRASSQPASPAPQRGGAAGNNPGDLPSGTLGLARDNDAVEITQFVGKVLA